MSKETEKDRLQYLKQVRTDLEKPFEINGQLLHGNEHVMTKEHFERAIRMDRKRINQIVTSNTERHKLN